MSWDEASAVVRGGVITPLLTGVFTGLIPATWSDHRCCRYSSASVLCIECVVSVCCECVVSVASVCCECCECVVSVCCECVVSVCCECVVSVCVSVRVCVGGGAEGGPAWVARFGYFRRPTSTTSPISVAVAVHHPAGDHTARFVPPHGQGNRHPHEHNTLDETRHWAARLQQGL